MNDKTSMNRTELIDAVDANIRNRQTRKVLATDTTQPLIDLQSISKMDKKVKQCIDVAGWAPFHYDRRLDGIAEPWRCALLLHDACRKLAVDFNDLFENVKPTNKIPKMLMACGALVLVNWIPEEDNSNEKIKQINEEHLAATAAVTQNLILALEARGFGTYWSSGGILGSPTFNEKFEIDPRARLIAALFVNYPGLYSPDSCEIIGGKNRTKRSSWTNWTNVIE